MKSRVHPKYKTKYRVENWPEYDQALVRRGDVTLWQGVGARLLRLEPTATSRFQAQEPCTNAPL